MKNISISLLFLLFSVSPLAGQQPPLFSWAKQLGGTADEEGRSVALSANGNVYSTGYFKGTADFNPGTGVYNLTSAGGMDIYISKIDSSGNFIWAKRIGGSSDDRGFSVEVDANENVYLTGFFQGTVDFDPGSGYNYLYSAGSWDIFVLKLNSSGNLVWVQRVGGYSGEAGFSLGLDSGANIYTTGAFSQTVDFNPGAGSNNLTSAGEMDVFVLKLDTNGNFLWAKRMGGPTHDQGFCLAADAVGNVYTTGYFFGTADFDPGASSFNLTSVALSDVFISKLDANGNFQWAKQIASNDASEGYGIEVDANGNVYTTGYFRSFADFDPGVGFLTLTSMGEWDIFLLKLNAAGNLVWAKQMGGIGIDAGCDFTIGPNDVNFLTGSFQGTVSFGSGSGSFSITSNGGADIFTARVLASGEITWAGSAGGAGNEVAYGIDMDDNETVISTGLFLSIVDFNPGAELSQLISFGNSDIFLMRMAKNYELGPVISLKGNMSFGDVLIGCQSQRILTIMNPGSQPLSVSSISYPFPVFSGSWSGSIPAGGSQDVIVTFIPTIEMTYNGDIIVYSNAYSGANTLAVSGKGISGPVTYSIGVSAQPENHPRFPDPIPLGSATTYSPAIAPVKICADGSKATIIQLSCDFPNLNMADIRFKTAHDDPDIDKYGKFDELNYESEPGLAKVRFTHPNYLEEGLLFRNDTIIAFNINCPSVEIIRFPIQIYRAPILFVHGLWGNDLSFQEMDQWFQYEYINENFTTVRADYSAGNGASMGFNENSWVVPQWTLNTLSKTILEKNTSCGKVDVVAHSMGGILSRLYLQSNLYGNDIHTLTTINTPHSGTQSANLLLSDLGIWTWIPLNYMGYCVNCGAVKDLKIKSPYFANNLFGNSVTVPSLVYTSDDNTPDFSQDWMVTYLIWLLNADFFVTHGVLLPPMLPPSLFRQETSDIIVPLSSQKGGVGITTPYSQIVHTNAEKNQGLFIDLKSKLSKNPSGSFFNHDGFQPSVLKMPWWDNIIFFFIPKLTPDSIEITNPLNNSVFYPGDIVQVDVSRFSGNINYIGCSLMNQGQNIYNSSAVDSALHFQYIIPANVYGEVKVLAYGFNGGGFDLDSISFFVNTNADLDSIKFQFETFQVPANTLQNLHVDGYYSDLVIKNISTMQGMVYTISDTNVVAMTSLNTFFAKQSGSTHIVADYLGFSDTMNIEVYQGPNYYSASFSIPTNVVCGSGDLQFTDDSGGLPVAWDWQFQGGTPSTSNEQNPLVHYSDAGAYDVMLITTWSDKTDTLSLSSYIIVESYPTAEITPSGPISMCLGDTVVLSADTVAGYYYLWSNDSLSQSIVVDQRGDYSLFVISENGCAGADSVSVEVISVEEPELIANGPTTFCIGDSVTLTSDSATEYAWSSGDTTQSIIVTTSGIFSVTVTDENGCTASSEETTVTVNPLPLVSFSGLTNDQTLYVYDTSPVIQLIGDPSGGVFTVNGDTISAGQFDPKTSLPGLNTVTYAFTDVNSCSDSFSITVTVIIIDATKDLPRTEAAVVIYPNPTDGMLYIRGKQLPNGNLQLSIIDILGRVVGTKKLTVDNNTIETRLDIKELHAGIYFLEIKSTETSQTYKVQKN